MTRTFQSIPESYTGTLVTSQPPDPNSPYTEKTTTTQIKKSVSRSDIVKNLPDSTGWRTPSPYTASITDNGMITGLGWFTEPTVINVPGLGTIRVNRRTTYTGYIGPVTLPSLVHAFAQNDINALVTRCLNDIKNQKINVSLAIIEARENVSMITKRLVTLTRAAKFAMGKQWKKAASELGSTGYKVRHRNSVHNGWLELQFGWLPLLNDIHGAYSALTDPKFLENALVVARGRKVLETTDTYTSTMYTPLGNISYSTRTFNEYRHELKGSLWYRMNLTHVSEAASLGLTNPLAVAWERVPFSFLFDYLVPVGNVLDALDATAGLTKLGVSITRHSRVHTTVAGSASSGGPSVQGAISGEASKLIMTRTIPTSVYPMFYYKNPFSAAHAANTVALFLRNKP